MTLLELLRKLEFTDRVEFLGYATYRCAICGGYEEKGYGKPFGHTPTCDLAKAIQTLKEE
jgi:hypothetical protein